MHAKIKMPTKRALTHCEVGQTDVLAMPYLNALCCKMVTLLYIKYHIEEVLSIGRGGKIMNYFVGLDIGTESVGWAVTDEGYAILKKNGHALWGVRQFRKRKRRKNAGYIALQGGDCSAGSRRLAMLRDIFAPEIAQVDLRSFSAWKRASFWSQTNAPSAPLLWDAIHCFQISATATATITASFPSIYHLRKALILEDRDLIFASSISLSTIFSRARPFSFRRYVPG